MASAANRSYPAIQGEVEVELEDEFENEFDAPARSFEAEDEWEDEAEDEWEGEDEDEWEDEQFFGALGPIAKMVGGLIGGGGDGEYEDEFDFETEAESEYEAEDEDEYEGEDEAFVNPIRRIYPDAELMAHLSMHAARARTEGESEAFVAALVPMASRLIPRAAKVVRRHAPTLIKGTVGISRQLRRNPATRRFVAALPVILQRTVQSLADRAAKGQQITAQLVISVLTRVAARVLREPGRRNGAMRAVNTFDRRFRNRAQRSSPSRRTAPSPRSGSRPASRRPRVQPRRRRRTRR